MPICAVEKAEKSLYEANKMMHVVTQNGS